MCYTKQYPLVNIIGYEGTDVEIAADSDDGHVARYVEDTRCWFPGVRIALYKESSFSSFI